MRITTPDDLFFPVATQPVFARITDGPEVSIPGKMAVIDSKTNKVLGVVSRDYRLVTNEKACAYARQCARAVFTETSEHEWEIFAADAPQSMSYCHIDLRHKTGKLDFHYLMTGVREHVPEAYGPYIRVTNSYNAQRALKFTIGYHRKICENGLTARDDLISFSFAHTRGTLQSEIDFVVNHSQVTQMQRQFKEYFDALRTFELSDKAGPRLVQVILALRKPKSAEKDDPKFDAFRNDWFRLVGYTESLYRNYSSALGSNAYSALQAATDLASHSWSNLCLRKDKHTLQRLASEWMVEFKGECTKKGFDLDEYLERPTHAHEELTTSRGGRHW